MLFLCINASSAEEPLNQTLGADIGDAIAINDASGDELSANGDTFVVDANGGGDYTTISDAVSAATGGETIFVKTVSIVKPIQ
jgi:pectin methylesterase-like acyl-CoA thioesterase